MLMESVEGSKFGPAIPIEMQTRLVDTWAENCVPEFYEILFLQYVKRLPTNEAEITIQEDIRSLRKGNSYIQLFLKTMREKEKLEQFMAPATPGEPELEKLCECLRKLRELNFKAAHYLYKIRSKYDESEKNTSEKYFFHRFSTRLDQFRKVLLKSKLSRVVTWQGQYDPFFMSLKAHGKSTQEENHALEDLFALPVDDSYRFLKMRKVLVGWIYLDSSPKGTRPISPPLEEKYIAFPQIKNGLIKERSIELQKLKQIPIQEDIIYKRSQSRTDSDVDMRYKDTNRTRYFWPRENLRQSNRNQPLLLGKSVQDNHLSSISNTPYQLPSRNERKSEDVGKIRRSRIAQLNNNILSRASKPRYVESAGKPQGYRAKLERLNTLPFSPQKSNRYDGNQMGYSPSRMLTKSLLINIMISPIRPLAPKLPEQRQQQQPNEAISSTITEKPPQPRMMTVQSVELGRYDQTPNVPSTFFSSEERQLKKNSNNPLQSRLRQDATHNQPTRRNVSNTVEAPKDTRDNVRSTIVISKQSKPQQKSSYVNACNNGEGSKPINTQNFLRNDNKISTNNQNANQESSISNYFPRKQTIKQPQKIEPIKQEPITQKQITPPPKSQPVYSFISPQNGDQNGLFIPKTETSKPNQTSVSQPVSQNIASSNIQPYTNNVNSNGNTLNNNTPVLQSKNSIPPQNVSPNMNPSNNYPSNPNTNPQNPANINSNSTVPPYAKPNSNPPPPPSEIKASTMAVSKQQKREIKVKVGKLAYSELVEYLNAYSIHPQYSETYDIQKILKQTELQQTYLIEFLINDQPGALALSSIVPVNNYAIRLWLIHSSADPSLSPLLFRKHVELVQKYITAPIMYFKGQEIPELADAGFVMSKEKLYSRNRASKPREIQREFEQYFSCECSHISFPQRQKEDVLFSQQIQKFDNKNSLSAESLFSMQGFSGSISNMVKVNRGLNNFIQVNKLLEEDEFDEYEANKSITASPIDLLRLAYASPIKDPFTAGEGVFKFYGTEITTNSQLLYCVNLSKNNGKLYFGKNYQTIEQFSVSLTPNPGKRGRFCVPMFTKNLYGRYQKFRENERGFYGNWEISLVFEDEMQGRVKHSTNNSASLTCPFFVGLEVEGSLLYCIEVSKDDLVY